jgi:hypothetical protein
MASIRYRDRNLGIGWGISRSDRTSTAAMPRKKNRMGGLRKLSRATLRSIGPD